MCTFCNAIPKLCCLTRQRNAESTKPRNTLMCPKEYSHSNHERQPQQYMNAIVQQSPQQTEYIFCQYTNFIQSGERTYRIEDKQVKWEAMKRADEQTKLLLKDITLSKKTFGHFIV